MAFAAASRVRVIPGAVATLGVSERVAFLRRTYAHLGVALLLFAGLTAGMMRYATSFSLHFSEWALGGRWNWILLMLAFMGIGSVARRMATSDTSRGVQYVGLTLAVALQALILQPLLWVALMRSGTTADFNHLILNAADRKSVV